MTYCAVLALSLGGIANVASATTITSPVSASWSASNLFSEEFAIDQSGLDTNFIDGVTDFDAFLAGSPTHFSDWGTNWLGGTFTGYIEFDLGEVMHVDRVAIWNYSHPESSSANAVTSIDVFADSSFIGSFNLTVPTVAPNTAEVIVFAPVDAQLIRFDITGTNGQTPSLGEVAFSTTPVPEPSTTLLLGISLLGLAAGRCMN